MWAVVESYDYQIEHRGRHSAGVVAESPGSERLYLHVIELTHDDLGQLGPRVDEHGNKSHDRLALPRNEEWWVAVDGDAFWPRLGRVRVRSHCTAIATRPTPVGLTAAELARLREEGVPGLPTD